MKNFRVLLILALAVTACSDETNSWDLAIRGVLIEVEIAASSDERAEGLMYREEVPEGTGMLFVFEEERPQSFWMKNTLVPLSIAYIDATGRILEIHDMEPLSLAPVRSRRPAQYALEVPQGFFQRNGISPGDTLDTSALPEQYRIAH